MLRRLIPLLVLLAAAVAVAVWLADNPGAITVQWLGWQVSTSVALLLVAVLVVLAVLWVAVRLLSFLVGLPARLGGGRRNRRQQIGVRALADGVAAAAVGETRRAVKLARVAERSLDDPSLTAVLGAQAAALAGDDRRARDHYNTLLARPETAALGLRGLLQQALARGDRAEAIELATQARQAAPGDSWTAETLFDLLIRGDRLGEAETLIEEAARGGAMDGASAARRRALVLNQRAMAAMAEGDQRAALAFARRAVAADAGVSDAAARLAALYVAADRRRRADGVLARAWRAAPSPDLLRAIADEAPLVRLYRLERMTADAPENADASLALGETALEARLWGQARKHLADAVRLRPTQRAYELLARVEEGEYGNQAAARDWRDKAATASRDPSWVCGACHGPAPVWTLTCPHCGAVDRLTWRAAMGAASAATAA